MVTTSTQRFEYITIVALLLIDVVSIMYCIVQYPNILAFFGCCFQSVESAPHIVTILKYIVDFLRHGYEHVSVISLLYMCTLYCVV